MSASDRRNVRAWLEALRQNPRPLLIASAKVTRRPGDQLDSTIAPIAVVMVMMSVTMTVIVHGEVRPIDNPLTMLPDAAQFGRCGRRAAYGEFSARFRTANRQGKTDDTECEQPRHLWLRADVCEIAADSSLPDIPQTAAHFSATLIPSGALDKPEAPKCQRDVRMSSLTRQRRTPKSRVATRPVRHSASHRALETQEVLRIAGQLVGTYRRHIGTGSETSRSVSVTILTHAEIDSGSRCLSRSEKQPGAVSPDRPGAPRSSGATHDYQGKTRSARPPWHA